MAAGIRLHFQCGAYTNFTLEVLGDTYLASLHAIGTSLKSTYSALEEASAVWYEASMTESTRMGALEEEANLVLDKFSELEDGLVEQEFGSLLRRIDGGTSLEGLLKSEGETQAMHRLPGMLCRLCSMAHGERIGWPGCATSSGSRTK
jgi:hypothetical protein